MVLVMLLPPSDKGQAGLPLGRSSRATLALACGTQMHIYTMLKERNDRERKWPAECFVKEKKRRNKE